MQLPDTVAASQIGVRFTPTYKNDINGDVTAVSMKNAFDTQVRMPFGSLFSFLLSAEEKHYRTQNKFDQNKIMNATVAHTFNVFSTGSLGFIDSRVFNRSILQGGRTETYIFNDQSVNLGGTYDRTYRPHGGVFKTLRVGASGTGAAVLSERAYKNDQTLAASGFGRVGGALRALRVSMDASGGRRSTRDRSETIYTEFDNLGSEEDSLSTGFSAEIADSVLFDADYVYYNATRVWADQFTNSSGDQQQGARNVFQEAERRNSESVVLALRAKIFNRFRLTLTGNHDEQLYDYAVQTSRYSNTITNGLAGTIDYVAPWKTTALVTLENIEADRDLGPLSIASSNDTRRKASLALAHKFRPSFSLYLLATSQLARTEYDDPVANPRDRDQLDTSVNFRIQSTPYDKFVSSISVAYAGSDVINIDASQSKNNRTRTLYELKPAFTYYVSDRFSIGQSYSVSIEYTDFTFQAEDNFVDRNLIFTNRFDFKPTTRIGFLFDYAYNFHDNGSYLPDETGHEELYVQSEDRRDRFNLRLDYLIMTRTKRSNIAGEADMKQSFGIFAEQRFNRFEDRSLESNSKAVTTDGQITLGSRGDYDFGTGKFLRFSIARVKKFSKFSNDINNNYWDMRSEFNYAF